MMWDRGAGHLWFAQPWAFTRKIFILSSLTKDQMKIVINWCLHNTCAILVCSGLMFSIEALWNITFNGLYRISYVLMHSTIFHWVFVMGMVKDGFFQAILGDRKMNAYIKNRKNLKNIGEFKCSYDNIGKALTIQIIDP